MSRNLFKETSFAFKNSVFATSMMTILFCATVVVYSIERWTIVTTVKRGQPVDFEAGATFDNSFFDNSFFNNSFGF